MYACAQIDARGKEEETPPDVRVCARVHIILPCTGPCAGGRAKAIISLEGTRLVSRSHEVYTCVYQVRPRLTSGIAENSEIAPNLDAGAATRDTRMRVI